MKTFFKKVMSLSTVFSFIVLAGLLAACGNPFALEEEGQGIFTISIGTNNAKTTNSRAVAYPPGDADIANLKFVVKFTPLNGGTTKTFTATGSSEFNGSIDIGHYKVTMDVYTLSDGLIYARGVADNNPVEIQTKGNFIHVDAYDARNTEPPVISEQPKGAAYHIDEEAEEMAVVADKPGDGGTLRYQWYKNADDSNSGGTLISGATSASYTPPTGKEEITYYYVMITNYKGGSPASTSITSKPARVFVGNNAEPPRIKTLADVSVPRNSTLTLTVEAEVEDGGELSYQWYSHTANSTTGGTLISGATSASYTPPTGTEGTIYYYVVVTNTNADAPGLKTATSTIETAEVKVTVTNAVAPTITGHPQGATYIENATATALTVTATGSGTLSYQWYRNTANNTTGGTAVGGNSASYTPVTTALGYLYYYCVVTITIANNGDGGTKTATATSSVATVTVMPTGAFDLAKSVTLPYTGETLTIPEGYTKVTNSSSNPPQASWYKTNFPNLTSVIIGNSVTSIETNAFYKCENLTSVTIENSVTSIGKEAFNGCFKLKSITIPASVKSIASNAFISCNLLAEINVDPTSESYSSDDGILYNKGKTSLMRYPQGKSAGSFIIPNSITSIGSHAFYLCTSLTSVTIPDGVKSIESDAFYGCTSLTDITIPASVTSIGSYAFRNCTSLTSVSIPASVISIGSYAFNGCTKLDSVTFEGTIPSKCFSTTSPFNGDLRAKFYATDAANGTPGTYTTTQPVSSSSVWTKQP